MRIALNEEEKKRYISRLLKIKRVCLDANIAIEDIYKASYECAKELKEEGKFNSVLKSMYLDLKSYIVERNSLNKIKKAVIDNGRFSEDTIALTVDELIDMDGRANVLIGPIVYDESIPKHCLKNLVMVCSDADFSALDDSTYLTGLEIALGNLILGKLSSSISLFFTAGKTDLSRVNEQKYLPLYQFAGDDILVSHISKDLNLLYINGYVYVMGYDINIEPLNACLKNKVTYYPNVDEYEKDKQDIFTTSYKTKRMSL